jgi:hypothetical protein
VDDRYVVLSNSEDGEVQLEILTKSGLERQLNEGYWGDDPFFFSQGDVTDQIKGGSAWDFANYGPRGLLVFPLDAVRVPRAVKTAVTWEV